MTHDKGILIVTFPQDDRDNAIFQIGKIVGSHHTACKFTETFIEGYAPYYEGDEGYRGLPFVSACGIRVYYGVQK